MKYLTNKDLMPTNEVPTTSKRACANFAIDLFIKMFKPDSVVMNDAAAESILPPTEEATATQSQATVGANVVMSYKDHLSEQLRLAINKEQSGPTAHTSSSNWETEMKATLKFELAAYEKSNVLGKNLNLLLCALSTKIHFSLPKLRTGSAINR